MIPRAFFAACCAACAAAFTPPTRRAAAGAPVMMSLPGDEAEPEFAKLDALGEKLRARRAANDFLAVATNELIISEDEAAVARDKIENPDPDAPPEVPKERYSRFGDWFDIIAK